MPAVYSGKVRNGQLVISEDVLLPENANFTVTLEIPSDMTKAERQGKAIKRFLAAVNAENGETFTDEDFAALENSRTDTDANIARLN